jgi:eukaryotic-like serine/threonine-protein kinase
VTAEQDPTTVAHFRILGRLGQGGMGVVYLAEDEKLRRKVALKLLPDASRNEERRQRFLREARSAAAITHPNVAVIHQVDEADGRVYIAMELIEGESLRARLERGPLDLATAKELALQMARGLAAAHDKGIVHRDLKPENVMITPAGVVKLLDFGLAKAAAESPETGKTAVALAKTETLVTSEDGRVMGTPDYMSPEQAVGTPLDVRSDVFSFGIVFYEMLAGSRPFMATTTGGMLVAIARDPMLPLQQRAPHVDEATAELVARCLAKAPADRFVNAGDVVAALGGKVSPQATTKSVTEVKASVATVPDAVKRTGRSRPGFVAMGAVAVVALVAWRWSAGRERAAPAVPTATAPSASSASAQPPVRTYKERRLTAFPAENMVTEAALTLDGASLVFGDNDGFWVQPVAGGPRRRLGVPLAAGDHTNSVSILPDNAHAVIGVERKDVITGWFAALDGTPARILPDAVGGAPRVSPDGTRLAACNSSGRLQIVPLAGGSWTTVATGCSADLAVRWSPDARHVAFEGEAGDVLMVASADGSRTESLLQDPLLVMRASVALDWPEPHRIVFGSRSTELGDVVLRELTVDDEGRAASPPRDLWRTHAVDLASLEIVDGRMLIIPTQAQDDVYVAKLAAGGRRLEGTPERLSMSDADDRTPQWLPDGRVVYYSDRDLAGSLYAQTPGKADARLLVEAPVVPQLDALKTGEIVYRRILGPDGGITSDPRAATVDRFMVRRPGQPEREFLRGPTHTMRVGCSGTDPPRCVLGEMRAGVRTFSRIDLTSGHVDPPFSRVPDTAPVPMFTLSPDGATVVAASAGSTLTVIRVADGSSREFSVTPATDRVEALDFTPDGRGVIFTGIGVDGQNYGLAHVDLSGHGELLLGAYNAWIAFPAVSPDGRSVAFQEQIFDSDVWLLEPQ